MWKELLAVGSTALFLSACGGGKTENNFLPPTPVRQAHSNLVSPPDFLDSAPNSVARPEIPAVVFGENVSCKSGDFPKPELKSVRRNSTIRALSTEVDLIGNDLSNMPIRGPKIVLSSLREELGISIPPLVDYSAILSIVPNGRNAYIVSANFDCINRE